MCIVGNACSPYCHSCPLTSYNVMGIQTITIHTRACVCKNTHTQTFLSINSMWHMEVWSVIGWLVVLNEMVGRYGDCIDRNVASPDNIYFLHHVCSDNSKTQIVLNSLKKLKHQIHAILKGLLVRYKPILVEFYLLVSINSYANQEANQHIHPRISLP